MQDRSYAYTKSAEEMKFKMHSRNQQTLAVQSPLDFDQCLNAVRCILQNESFEIISETYLPKGSDRDSGPERRRLAVLVVWSTLFARQALSVDRDAGLLMPFSISVMEGETGSMVASADSTRLAVAVGEYTIRVLARVLEAKIKQLFLQLSAQGPTREAVIRGGGTYRGIQYGSRKRGMPDLVLFDDPVTKTTLALVYDGSAIRSEAVTAKIMASRGVFDEAQIVHDDTGLSGGPWDESSARTSLAI